MTRIADDAIETDDALKSAAAVAHQLELKKKLEEGTYCCCCLPCNHCSNWTWVVVEILAFLVICCVLRAAGSPFI